MNPQAAYELCCKYQGKRVRITDNQGNIHRGHITKVDNRMVWLMPETAGYGLGFWGFRAPGFGYGIALGAITGIALASIFLW